VAPFVLGPVGRARRAMETVRSPKHFAPRDRAASITPHGPRKHEAGRTIVEGAHDWTG
jgi:hypothetical protein